MLIKTVGWDDDESADTRLFDVPDEVANALVLFLTCGRVAPELHKGLLDAQQMFAMASTLRLEDANLWTKTVREGVICIYLWDVHPVWEVRPVWRLTPDQTLNFSLR